MILKYYTNLCKNFTPYRNKLMLIISQTVPTCQILVISSEEIVVLIIFKEHRSPRVAPGVPKLLRREECLYVFLRML